MNTDKLLVVAPLVFSPVKIGGIYITQCFLEIVRSLSVLLACAVYTYR